MNNEPVAWMHQNPDYPISKHRSLEYNIPLYTHQIKDLTEDEIKKCADSVCHAWKKNGVGELYMEDFARAILRKAQNK